MRSQASYRPRQPRWFGWALIGAALAVLVTPGAASAQRQLPTDEVPKQLEGVGVDERLGAKVPMDLIFTTSDGKEVTLGSLFD